MLERLGRFLVRRRRRVAISAVVVFAVAGAVGGGVAEHLSSGGFEDRGAESYRAYEALEDEFDSGDPNFILLVTPKVAGGEDTLPVDDPRVAAAGVEITRRLASKPEVKEAVSYWTLGGAPPLRSRGGDRALVLAFVSGNNDEIVDAAEDLSAEFGVESELLEVGVGGFAQVFEEVGGQIEDDLTRAELIAFPITLLLLILIFRGVIAAVLPLGVGFLAIVSAFLVLRILAAMTEVSIFALNLVTAMGLGLAIDYSLFVVSRFREELARGLDVPDAVARTVGTAGRTVLYSSLTVAVSLAALLVFPLSFLRSFAYGGIPVVLIAGAAALIVLPAVLAMLGHRIDKWSIRPSRPKPEGEGAWHRIAVAVMRRPLPIATAVVAVLLFLGAPFLHINLGLPDDRVLPESASARQVHDTIRQDFDASEANTVSIVALGVGDPSAREGDIDAYASRLSRIEGVGRVEAMTGVYLDGQSVPVPTGLGARYASDDSTWLSVVPSVEPISEEGEALVEELRSAEAPFDVLVGGMSAQLVDSKDSLFGLLPVALGMIAITTFVVLFLMVGSVVVPIKALVLNLLSLTATFGAMVWIFQDGHLAGFLDFTPVGAIEVTTPILMFCVAFGLSMDYEVFLLSRIKEEYDRTGDNEHSVAVGLERTGRIVTAAALLISLVFLAFATSEVTFIKLFGLGLAMAVLVDASLVRATLVPAFMRLAGRANWWAPRPLARLYDRFGLTEREVIDVPRDGPHTTETAETGRPRTERPLVAAGRERTTPESGRRARRGRPLRARRR